MSADFSITVDRHRDLVRITMTGMFGPQDAAAFVEARNAAHLQLACPANAHLTLNDIRGMKIQSQETVAEFRRVLANPKFYSRKLAFVVAPSLTARQLERALDSRDARFFNHPDKAFAWLMRDRLAVAQQPDAPVSKPHAGLRVA